jgi:hypothetical protein
MFKRAQHPVAIGAQQPDRGASGAKSAQVTDIPAD